MINGIKEDNFQPLLYSSKTRPSWKEVVSALSDDVGLNKNKKILTLVIVGFTYSSFRSFQECELGKATSDKLISTYGETTLINKIGIKI